MRNSLHKDFRVAYLLILSLPFLICYCSDPENPTSFAFEYNYPDDCCTAKGWSTNFDEYETGVRIFYPNVMTPSSESENSVYYIHTNMQIASIASAKIYSQAGDVVFENKDFEPNKPAEGWDGLVDGNLIEGAYKVLIELAKSDGTILTDEIIICVLECQTDLIFHYQAQGMDFTDCRWIGQHGDEGNFDETVPGEDCL